MMISCMITGTHPARGIKHVRTVLISEHRNGAIGPMYINADYFYYGAI
jgi:hypothetical protein